MVVTTSLGHLPSSGNDLSPIGETILMRIGEMTLLAVLAVSVIVLLVPMTKAGASRTAIWATRIALGAVVVILALQLAVEHPRIQLLPAYTLAVVVILLSARRLARWGGRPRTPARVFGGLVALLLLATSAVAAVVFPVWTMPTPTGEYAVGAVDVEFDDTSRPETHTSDSTDTRRVMTTVWYPVEPDAVAGRETEPYPDALGAAVSSVFGLPDVLFSHVGLVSTHVVSGAPAARGAAAFPVIVFSPGVLSTRFQSMAMVEELVSRGFVVVGIDHPYTSGEVVFSDGSTAAAVDDVTEKGSSAAELYAYNVSEVGIRVADVSFVLDQLAAVNADDPSGLLTGRLDLGTIGIVGHSFGGATAVQALSVDDRIDAGLSLEGGFWGSVTTEGLTKPFGYLASSSTADAFRSQDTESGYSAEIESDLRATLGHSTSDVYAAVIDGFIHQSFTDLALVSPALFSEGMDPLHNVDITRTEAAWFFEKFLHGDDVGAFGTDSDAYPEVRFARVPADLFD